MDSSPARNRRADARRSRAAILDAAIRLLNAQPDARVEAIARAAGVTRQTVYAHFPSREQLLAAVVDQITDEAVQAMEAVDIDDGPAADALLRLLEAGTQVSGRYPALIATISSLPVSPQADHERHAPIADRLKRVIQRGQQTGEFGNRLSPDWLVTATIKLGHAAQEEVDAGRMFRRQATEALRISLLRLLSA